MSNKQGFVRSLFDSNVNPVNQKARNIPILNIMDKYSRAFHLSWLGFFVAFLSWFAFPPLLHGAIQEDLQLTKAQIANSNIVGLVATLLVRAIVGPLCDRYGPRLVMVGCLLSGAMATACTPLISNTTELNIIRFFVGILGGTFVPCQVWTSQFFDKNIVGLANALAAGWGNAGGGAAFFLMPAIVSLLMSKYGFSQYWAWRMAFPMCPLVFIVCTAILTLIFGDDTPNGSWSSRHKHQIAETNDQFENASMIASSSPSMEKTIDLSLDHELPLATKESERKKDFRDVKVFEIEDEVPQAPSAADILKIALSSQTLLVSLPYLCSFGSELAVEGVISDFYIQTAKISNNVVWNEQTAGKWAAVFGLLNLITRPLGGYISDLLYQSKGLNAKKWWLIFLGVMQGIFFILIGFMNLNIYHLIGMMTGLAIFMEAANGAIFSLVPSIHPKFNGVVSGFAGAAGNMGGVLFGLAFRFQGTDYQTALWIIGVSCLGANLGVTWISVR
ncbi:unnamed protein product [Rotaria socialis]|uniref:Nitrate/nitrite transporter n=1 Tax=Rotaria socialis TaxID=392032 RepID=A0A820ZRL3_9BILA|nr:unnamed protein product [Rotaria socialis]CAF4567242.1 unnamed protein product [Rotaria socialis]